MSIYPLRALGRAGPLRAQAPAASGRAPPEPPDSFHPASAPLVDKSKDDLSQAPPSFDVGGTPAIFVDFQQSEATLTVDAVGKTATATASVEFDQPAAGY